MDIVAPTVDAPAPAVVAAEAALRASCPHIGVVWYPPLLSENPGRTSAKDEGRTPPPLSRSEILTFQALVRRSPKREPDVGNRIVTRKASIDATLSPETVAELRERLRPDKERLEELTGRSFTHWRDGTD